jgi:hypothetical protein
MIKGFAQFLVLIFSINSFAALESGAGRNCVDALSEVSDGTTQYKFIRTGPRGSYNVVEIPTYAASGKYVTVYTEKGYVEMNSETGACNKKSGDKSVNSNQKILELFKKRLERYKADEGKVAEAAIKVGKPMAASFGVAASNLHQDTLKRNCSADFADIADYVEKNGGFKKNTPQYIDPVPCTGAGCPPSVPDPRGVNSDIIPPK